MAEPVAPKSGRGLRIALAVSLALNLGVAGLLAGAWLRSGPHGGPRDLGFGPFAAALTAEDRAALRRAFLDRAPEFRDARAAMRADMAGILAALRADPFDAAGLKAALDQTGTRMAGRLALGQSLVFDRVAAMSPADRMAFADRLENALNHGPGRRPRRDGAPAP